MPRAPFYGRPTPPSQLTDDEVANRWKVLTPNFFRYLILFATLSLGLFLFNHFAKPSQRVTDFLNVTFQISCALTVYYIMLCGMALFYSRSLRKQPQSTN